MKVLWRVHYDFLDSRSVCVSNADPDEFANAMTRSHAKHRVFRMYDDDGELYYEGHMIGADGSDPMQSCDIFAPLDDYGMPNAGCTELRVLNDKDEWESI